MGKRGRGLDGSAMPCNEYASRLYRNPNRPASSVDEVCDQHWVAGDNLPLAGHSLLWCVGVRRLDRPLQVNLRRRERSTSASHFRPRLPLCRRSEERSNRGRAEPMRNREAAVDATNHDRTSLRSKTNAAEASPTCEIATLPV